MWLEDLICINYKSLRRFHIRFARDTANVLIGINDCGKSTIQRAIGLLFCSPKFKFNFPTDFQARSDLSNSVLPENEYLDLLAEWKVPPFLYSGQESLILGKLIIEDDERTANALSTYSPILQWTIERSDQDLVWLASYSNTANATTQSYLLTWDLFENGQPSNLRNESQTNLKNRVEAEKLNPIKSDPERTGQFTKDELINAICANKDLQPHWLSYEKMHFRMDAEALFPEFQYLDWNISFSELEEVANVAVKDQIEEQILRTKKFAEDESRAAQKMVNDELDRFRIELSESLPNIEAIKASIFFKVESKLTDIFVHKTNTDGDIYLESQGEGIKRQIWFALLKWKASKGGGSKNALRKKYLWCFDEPETHLYPQAQRDFFEVLKKIAGEEFQLIISTHSTIFIDRSRLEDIYRLELHESYSRPSKCTNVTGVFDALSIRNSDFLFYDKFLVVEGDTERVLIPHLFELWCGSTLTQNGIQLVPLGGKNKRKEHCVIFENLLRDYNKGAEGVVYLLDNDARFEMTRKEQEQFCKFTSGRQDIEDAIPLTVWEAIVRKNFGEDVLSVSQLKTLYDGIPNDRKIPSNQKFYEALRSSLRAHLRQEDRVRVDDCLPAKGSAQAEILIEHLTEKEHENENIVAAFTALIDQ